MATVFSTQMTQINAGTKLKASERLGRVRLATWQYTVPAGNQAINDVIILTKLPKSARVITGREFHSAMSTGAGAATVEIGTYTRGQDGTYTLVDVDLFLAATSVDAAGQTDIANTLALGALDELIDDGEIYVGAKVTVEAWAAAGNFEGFLLFALD